MVGPQDREARRCSQCDERLGSWAGQAIARLGILVPGQISLTLVLGAAMGLVYSVIGAAVVVEKAKESVRFQQGVLGLGIGTMELVPFWKIDLRARWKIENENNNVLKTKASS